MDQIYHRLFFKLHTLSTNLLCVSHIPKVHFLNISICISLISGEGRSLLGPNLFVAIAKLKYPATASSKQGGMFTDLTDKSQRLCKNGSKTEKLVAKID